MRRCSASRQRSLITCLAQAAPPASPVDWKAKISESMPLLGHRNSILVVDSAYPLQSCPSIETMRTDSSQLEVVQYILGPSVGPSISILTSTWTQGLPLSPTQTHPAPQSAYAESENALHGLPVQQECPTKESSPPRSSTKRADEYHLLVLKTSMTIPSLSVFIRLDCKYWSGDAEERMRAPMRNPQTRQNPVRMSRPGTSRMQ